MASAYPIDRLGQALDIEGLARLRNYLIAIRATHFDSMVEYVARDRLGFCHQIARPAEASLASTSTCVASLVAVNKWKDFPLAEGTAEVAAHLIKRNRSAGLKPGNPFSISFVAEGILDLASSVPGYSGVQAHLKKIRRGIVPRLKAHLRTAAGHHEEGSIAIEPYPPSAYLTQLALRIIQRCGAADDTTNRIVHAWSRSEINKQVSLITAKSRISDPMQLAYALISAVGTLPEDRTSPEDKEIFAHALSLFFSSQNDDGSWPLSRPMFHYRDVGNAYCFEYELLTQLLQCSALRDELLNYLPRLELAARLLSKTRFDLDKGLEVKQVGWASGHHPQLEGPESWSTASVYHFAHVLDRLVAEAIRRALFAELKAPYARPPGDPPVPPEDGSARGFAPDFLDARLDTPDAEAGSLKLTLAVRFVFPLAKEVQGVAKGGKFSKSTPMSAILFGPPGTSKTEMAKLIRDYLKWPLLQVDPSYLVQEGLDRVQAMANRLFSLLLMSEQVVVLLDEFDEMGRARTANQDILSRFITTAMLPKLAAINDERKIVFLLATNYVSGFDAAFSRSGRFDMRIQVMPPTFEAKADKWPMVRDVVSVAQSKLQNSEQMMSDLTYSETEKLVRQWTAQPGQDAAALLSEAWQNCTLQKPLNPPADGRADSDFQSKLSALVDWILPWKQAAQVPANWAESAKNDRKYMLIPAPPGS